MINEQHVLAVQWGTVPDWISAIFTAFGAALGLWALIYWKHHRYRERDIELHEGIIERFGLVQANLAYTHGVFSGNAEEIRKQYLESIKAFLDYSYSHFHRLTESQKSTLNDALTELRSLGAEADFTNEAELLNFLAVILKHQQAFVATTEPTTIRSHFKERRAQRRASS